MNNTHLLHQVQHEAKERGIAIDGTVGVDFAKLMAAKEKSVKQLTGGVESLFKKNKVEYLKGTGSFVDDKTVKVQPIDENAEPIEVQADNFIVATG